MKFTFTAIATLGLAAALNIPWADLHPCAPLKQSTVPEPVPNTLETFKHFVVYSNTAASALTPIGFERILVNSDAAIRSDKFMTYYELPSYDTNACADICKATRGCDSFNIYFQRNPSIAPAVACPNPEANVLVHCGLYSEPVLASQALNFGQVRGPADANDKAFQVAIRGSNGNSTFPIRFRIMELTIHSAYNKAANSISNEPASVVVVTAPCTRVSTSIKLVTFPGVTFTVPTITLTAPTVTISAW
ncbi:hypothetical protein BKA66DRAFT_588395 [Pyrenochaeta sp. MPI-SDFR-AT-0127]|nr:hypothetical protein BKA66DRAFT_588395 [Pyrenochaeta sp. MPI-SDFR-AT-0127]